MEAMASDEVGQDRGQKSGREELEDTVQEQIRAKEHEISEMREEIRNLREEIKEKEEDIKKAGEEIRGVLEIPITSGGKLRKALEPKLQFLQQQISSHHQQISSLRQEISSRDQQISSIRQEISSRGQQIISRDQQISSLRQEIISRDQQISSLRQEIISRDQQISSLRQEISSRDQQIIIHDQQISSLRQEISSRDQQIIIHDQQISSLRQEIISRDQQISSLRQEINSVRSVQASAESSGAQDNSPKWIKSMSIVKPELPRNKGDVTKVLFPEVHGKLPVTKRAYHSFKMLGNVEYLEEADDSDVPVTVTSALKFRRLSEMDTTSFISYQLREFFTMFQTYSPHTLLHTLIFNCNEKTGECFSDVTVDRSRPGTLCVASGRTLLIGEDKVGRLQAAEQDLRNKVTRLPPIYYGEMEFILGYIAAGSLFQWVYMGRNCGPDLSPISPCLDLKVFDHRCKFFLSLGYAYHLLCSMADAMPVVQNNHAMFTKDENENRTIVFYPDYVQKSVKKFAAYCEEVGTTVDAVKRAYDVSKGCPFLPQCTSELQFRHSGRVIIEYSPVGYYPSLRSEQDVRNMAGCVCEALRVLHMNSLVHRDVKPPNIVRISKNEFMLIDLETVAECPNRLPPGFPGFRGWSGGTLEGGVYTPMSDMYQLGQLLVTMRALVNSMDGKAFIQQLVSKNLSAELALKDVWLSNPMP